MNIYPYVYRLDHPLTGEFYIGYRCANKVPAEQDLGHKYFTSSKIIKPRFHEFVCTIVAECFDTNFAYDLEQNLIFESWHNEKCLNSSCFHGKKRLRIKNHSDESKLKMSVIAKGKRKPPIPSERIEKYRMSAKLYQQKTNQLKLLAESNKGIPRSEEIKRKISEGNKGKKRSDETKALLSKIAANISEETREKMRRAKLGRKVPKLVCRIKDQKEMTVASFMSWMQRSPIK